MISAPVSPRASHQVIALEQHQAGLPGEGWGGEARKGEDREKQGRDRRGGTGRRSSTETPVLGKQRVEREEREGTVNAKKSATEISIASFWEQRPSPLSLQQMVHSKLWQREWSLGCSLTEGLRARSQCPHGAGCSLTPWWRECQQAGWGWLPPGASPVAVTGSPAPSRTGLSDSSVLGQA